jgi:glutaredoxin
MNDGAARGRRYFSCPARHGLFTRPSNLEVVDADEGESQHPRGEASGETGAEWPSGEQYCALPPGEENTAALIELFVSSVGGSMEVRSNCRRAMELLQAKGLPHTLYDVAAQPAYTKLLRQLSQPGGCGGAPHDGSSEAATNFRPVGKLPRIRIGDQILGFDEMQELEDSGQLDAIMRGGHT